MIDKKQLIELCGSIKAAKKVVRELKSVGNLKDMLEKWKAEYDTLDGNKEDKAIEALNNIVIETKEEQVKQATETTEEEKPREKILIFGETSTGKTYTLLKIAERIRSSGAKMYVIDTDDGFLKIKNKKFKDLDNIIIYPCYSFKEITESFEEIKNKVKPNDWFALESLSSFWEMAQDEYVQGVYGRSMGDMLEEIKRRLIEAGKTKQPATLDRLHDWTYIKARHNRDVLEPFTKRLKCNVIATTTPKAIIDIGKGEDKDAVTREISSVFGDLGYRPGGEKHNVFRFDTTLLLERYIDAYTCDKCGKKYNRRVRQCVCGSREFTASYNYYLECFKDRGEEGFGRKKIEGDAYSTYLKYSK